MPTSTDTPRLLTRLWRRGPGEYQLGLDLEEGIGLTLDDDLGEAFALLDGRHTIPEAATITEVDEHRFRAAVDVIPDRFWATATPVHAVRIIGAGHLGRAFAEMWAQAHPEVELTLVDPDPPPPGLYSARRPTGALCLQALLTQRTRAAVTVRHHWWDHPSTPTVTVIAQDRAECDRALTGTLVRDGQPHLLLRPLPSGMVVGPFVDPGITSCVRCADLRRGQDLGWAPVLARSIQTTVQPAGHHLAWAASTAVIELARWMSRRRCALMGSTWEQSDLRDEAVGRAWPKHPECGCDHL